eukprot:m.66654 g.66654  ORF g.66654 m.66654 type:complete len:217 (+) comp7635_c0_seq1:201-851(+)
MSSCASSKSSCPPTCAAASLLLSTPSPSAPPLPRSAAASCALHKQCALTRSAAPAHAPRVSCRRLQMDEAQQIALDAHFLSMSLGSWPNLHDPATGAHPWTPLIPSSTESREDCSKRRATARDIFARIPKLEERSGLDFGDFCNYCGGVDHTKKHPMDWSEDDAMNEHTRVQVVRPVDIYVDNRSLFDLIGELRGRMHEVVYEVAAPAMLPPVIQV